jgi:hypothetical protein
MPDRLGLKPRRPRTRSADVVETGTTMVGVNTRGVANSRVGICKGIGGLLKVRRVRFPFRRCVDEAYRVDK